MKTKLIKQKLCTHRYKYTIKQGEVHGIVGKLGDCKVDVWRCRKCGFEIIQRNDDSITFILDTYSVNDITGTFVKDEQQKDKHNGTD